jgi:hypothetical protein
MEFVIILESVENFVTERCNAHIRLRLALLSLFCHNILAVKRGPEDNKVTGNESSPFLSLYFSAHPWMLTCIFVTVGI